MTQRWLRLLVIGVLVIDMVGCDAFVRKFTRKKKKDSQPTEELVLAPEEYTGPNLPKDELYRQYLLYAKSWLDELMTALTYSGNHKKQVACLEEALKNFNDLRPLLNEETRLKLDAALKPLLEVQEAVIKDPYCQDAMRNRAKVERIRRNLLRDFSYVKVKGALI